MKTSTKLLTGWLMLALVTAACGGNSQRVRALEQKADSLAFANEQQQMALDEITYFVSQIGAIMDTINVMEGVLTLRVDESGRPLGRRQILQNLDHLSVILGEKRAEINRLDSLLNLKDNQVKQLTTLVKHLYAELDQKDETIQNLKEEIQAKNAKIRSLVGQVDNLTTDIAVLSDTLQGVKERSAREVSDLREQSRQIKAQSQRVYYVIGTTKDLQESGVLTKAFMKKSTVNTGEFDESKFTQADMFELETIQFVGKQPKFMSMEPPAFSYVLVGTNKGKGSYTLTILEPEQFWNASKYLVIKVLP